MTDPEIEYQRLISGDAAALRSTAETLESAMDELDAARTEIADVCVVWTGSAADAFRDRTVGLRQGIALTRAAVGRARGALETSASAYDVAVDNANYYIGFWRNRPTLPPIIEEIFARLVNARLLSVGVAYNAQLAGVSGVLSGKGVDLDELDEDTREWVEKGLAKNESWMDGNNSNLGPLIHNIAATGDDRGLIPQGLGYVPGTGGHAGTLVQSYYTKDGESYVALIDEATGRELGEAQLGGGVDVYGNPDGRPGPTHAGGVAIDGDTVYVTDFGKVFTYSLAAIRNSSPGQPVPQSAPAQDVRDPSDDARLTGGSYSTIQDGKLYLGNHEDNLLHVYEKDASGQWQRQPPPVETPDNCQGVLVRDGEYVFSCSLGRDNASALVVQQKDDGTRDDPYVLPNMSEGVVEVNGEVIVNYESGAAEYDHLDQGWFDRLLGREAPLWANPFMTRTPLSDLGLGEDFFVEPATLTKAASELESPASTLMSVASTLDGVVVQPHALGEVPKAAAVSKGVNELVEFAADTVRTGAKAVALTSDNLAAAAHDYLTTDDFVGSVFTPR